MSDPSRLYPGDAGYIDSCIINDDPCCTAMSPEGVREDVGYGDVYFCTGIEGHTTDHAAHGVDLGQIATWPREEN